jgi:hypothetical protein
MRPMLVVMAGIDAKYVLELATVEDQQPVETLATDAADPALGVGVRVRCLDGGADHRDPFALEDVIAAAAELRVAIVDEKTERLLAIIERHQQVASLLGDPAPAGFAVQATNSIRRVFNEMKKSTWIRFNQAVSTVKKSQASVVAACWRRNLRHDSSSRCGAGGNPWRPDRPHQGRRNGDAEALQFADDPPVAPARILASKPNN